MRSAAILRNFMVFSTKQIIEGFENRWQTCTELNRDLLKNTNLNLFKIFDFPLLCWILLEKPLSFL